MQVTYQVPIGDHLRCFGKSIARNPLFLLQLLAAPLFVAAIVGFTAHDGNKLLTSVLVFAGMCVFIGVALVLQFSQWSQRPCTTTIWYDGIHDVTPEKANFVPWSNVKSAINSDGDVFIDRVSGPAGIYIARPAFSPQLPASAFVECVERARRGDFSMIVPPPQPAYSAPQYGAYPPQQQYPPQQYPPQQQPPPGTWPPPPGQGSM